MLRSQPSTATAPSRTSIATTSCSPRADAYRSSAPSSANAAVPITTRRAPAASKRLGVCERADASRRLDRDRLDRGHDGADERRVDPTRAGRTEVDEMDQLSATRRELSRERQRIGAPRDDAVERAALEPNGLSLEHVDCRDDRESILSS